MTTTHSEEVRTKLQLVQERLLLLGATVWEPMDDEEAVRLLRMDERRLALLEEMT